MTHFARISLVTLTCLSFVTLNGCSTIVEGSDQSMTVMSEPSDAACTLTRKGNLISVVDPTPNTIVVGRSKNDIRIECVKEGFIETTDFIYAESEGWAAGNMGFAVLSLGISLIGVGVDAATGATHQYPKSVEIKLIPDTFESEAARDSYFDERRSELEGRYDGVMQEIEDRCTIRWTEHCDIKKKAIEKVVLERLEHLERMRGMVKITDKDT